MSQTESPVKFQSSLRTDPSGQAISNKIKSHHMERLAVVYVRQSSAQQVLNHQESAALQYSLREKALAWGWPTERILVIDEDQAHSGSTAVGRTGFQRLLVEVGLNHVGLILGIEMSRLARSCKDWYQLLEVCAIFQSILADQDGLYDPRQYNDRLLLGLKGTISEAELHIIQQRMSQGRLNKAKRGELFNHPPIGYIRSPSGQVAKDPDEQVQAVVCLIFDQFEQLGSINAVLRYLVQNSIKIPVRAISRDHPGQLQWRRPNRQTLRNLLQHPIYAGAYTWGRRAVDPRRKIPGRPSTGRTVVAPEQCMVFLKDHCPAYITWDQYQAIRRQIADNQFRGQYRGSVREGSALLGGLLLCGHCGCRMMVNYSQYQRKDGTDGSQVHYCCQRHAIDYGGQRCQTLVGRVLDTFITEQVLTVLEPASIELSLSAAEDIKTERKKIERHWQHRLERAQYHADRAARQYHCVEPENRLVARELERQWEQHLVEMRQLKEQYVRFCDRQLTPLTDTDRQTITRLSDHIPKLWHAKETSHVDRKTIIRHLIDNVTVTAPSNSQHMDVTIQWAGGFTSEHTLVRPVARYDQLDNYKELISRILELHDQNQSCAQIANQLNQEGYHPPKRRPTFNGAMVRQLLSRQLRTGKRSRSMESFTRTGDEWWISDLSRHLQIPRPTLYDWIRRGVVQAKKLPGPQRPWIIWADADELDRLRRLRKCKRSWYNQPQEVGLTRPKPRPEA